MQSPFRLPRITPFGLGESFLEWMTGLAKLDRLYQKRPQNLSSFEFMRHTLKVLNVDYRVGAGSIENIPKEGPVLIVANHPLGAVEGVILADLIGEVRQDVKVLANQLLKRLPEISDLFIGVDVFEGKSSARTNAKAVRDAHKHLSDGGVLVVFPAGEVSTYRDPETGKSASMLADVEWSQSVAKFIKRSSAVTVPMYIDGKNSALFYNAGKIHPLLRTAMLGRELLNKHSSNIQILIGNPLPYSETGRFEDNKELVKYLRLNTYLMSPQSAAQTKSVSQHFDPIISPISPDVLESEIDALSDESCLLKQGDFEVYCAHTRDIPNMMQEIGRVREENFRAVGEGSGNACDIDEYDSYYRQLFVWQRNERELVGAYRMGLVDELLENKGIDGLYSKSLFQYGPEFLETLDTSIEMGRSVVTQKYQRNLNSLLLLWKGIAAFASKHPKYTNLFGPVSISNDYSPMARQLMMEALSLHCYDEHKAELVSPSVPFKKAGNTFWQPHLLSCLADTSLLSNLLSRMEDGKGLPVLLRQYLKMNGKLVCFNLDPDFNDTLDGLIVVDLRNVPLKTLGKYMGREEAKTYLLQHGQDV
ncbi:lysophospholipid acyltransferase family protein [Marinomonas mediterranea]|uniref:lysophospholipid acyltransferase family protein n=1 Tax=Marinomonas mediterranea TaxID=119864 RepID=UPI00234AFE01|nr:lysophospholipid acyltransferase family protein [Marinomonas mediterranea]WCN07791.1 GNAT family N-acetyltransferase [Marinomonas mediterranea]